MPPVRVLTPHYANGILTLKVTPIRQYLFAHRLIAIIVPVDLTRLYPPQLDRKRHMG
jgi:hypothetical protein